MNHPWIYVTANHAEGNHGDGWTARPATPEVLPSASAVAAASPQGPAKLGVLVEDTLLHPLRLTLEERVPTRDLDKFLSWKLKRFLPFDVSRAQVRNAPLTEDNTYITWSLPDAWLNQLSDGLAAKDAQCGYVGGVFATLLENSPAFRGKQSIALFDGLYIYAELDRAGQFVDFRTRRLPLEADNRLDEETLITSDWGPLLAGRESLVFCDFRSRSDMGIVNALGHAGIPVEALDATGSVLTRFTRWMGDRNTKARLNFAPKPFQTGQGGLLLLWAANLVLLLGLCGASWLWWNLRQENATSHQQIGALQQQQQSIAGDHAGAVKVLEKIDLRDYRKQLEQFHGIQTAFETHWGRLLDDLSGLMNDDVRLLSLSPRSNSESRKDKATVLYLSGQARSKDAQLTLIRTLQSHANFENVRFESEEYSETGTALNFEISFRYLPVKGGAS